MDNTVHFDLKSVCDGHHKVTYRGVPTVKCPFDYVLYQMIVFNVKPDLIIEIGTNIGGSALYLSDLQRINGFGKVHTIDIEDKVTDKLILKNRHIKRFLGGYEGYDLKNARKFKKILVIEDGSHVYEDVRNSLNKFHSLVSPGSYLIVEDGILTELEYTGYDGGPLRAIEEFLGHNKQFSIDREMCDLFGKNATFNVNGFLKRNL